MTDLATTTCPLTDGRAAPTAHSGSPAMRALCLAALLRGARSGCEVLGPADPRTAGEISCYKDSTSGRNRHSSVMDSDIQNIGKHVANRHSWPLTLEYCAQICHDMGKTIAGVVRPAPPGPPPQPRTPLGPRRPVLGTIPLAHTLSPR